jgi:alkanesulfonate monooxygenase SsuD/methylene tetrahydromethanopterin reductase-like flavin-dependent oxidoreductase (luciferase family)
MRFSVWLSSGRSWQEIRDGAIRAEATGWDGVWVPDHFMPPDGGYGSEPAGIDDPGRAPVHEAWTLLSAIAAVTTRVRLGVLVSGNTYRHPAVVAKMAATIDHVSNGRAVLGLGAGWQENEHRRYGLEYGSPRDRSDWLEESAAIVTGLFTNARTDHAGSRYHLVGAPLEPKPIQQPLPLMIGGGGERRTLRTAARYAQEWNVWGTPGVLASKNRVLDAHCTGIGRDPGTLERSAAAFLAFCDTTEESAERRATLGSRGGLVGTVQELRHTVDAYAAAGTDEVIIPDYNYSPTQRDQALDRFASEVLQRHN